MRIPKYESRFKAGELLAEFIKREDKNLEKRIDTLKEEIKSKDKEIKHLKKLLKRARSEYRRKLKYDKEISTRDKIISDLEYKLSESQKKLADMEKVRSLWEKIVSKEIIPIGIFPNKIEGLTWIKHSIKKKDLKKRNSSMPMLDCFKFSHLNLNMVILKPRCSNHSLWSSLKKLHTSILVMRMQLVRYSN